MVEVTLSIVLQIVQTTGILVGIIYYITIMRNTQRNQQNAEESRQLQLLMQFSSTRNVELQKQLTELLYMEWTTYDEFERKYGSDNNPDNFGMRGATWNRYNWMGILLRRGLIDRDIFFEYQSSNTPLIHWTKFGDVIKEIRRRYHLPLYCVDFEYLAEENRKYLLEKGFSATVPDTYYRYIPDTEN